MQVAGAVAVALADAGGHEEGQSTEAWIWSVTRARSWKSVSVSDDGGLGDVVDAHIGQS